MICEYCDGSGYYDDPSEPCIKCRPHKDKNEIILRPGDIINIHQTVNGQNLFYIKSLEPLEIYYNFDRNRRYEYSEIELLKPCRFTGESEFEIVK